MELDSALFLGLVNLLEGHSFDGVLDFLEVLISLEFGSQHWKIGLSLVDDVFLWLGAEEHLSDVQLFLKVLDDRLKVVQPIN